MQSCRALFVLLALGLPQCSTPADSPTGPAPHSTDGGSVAPQDAGISETPDVPPRFDPAAACISDSRWTRRDNGSALMNPGRPCLECHSRNRNAPIQSVAGTAYYAPHEEDLCNGYSGDPPGSWQGAATVRLLDAEGVMHTLSPNSAGNFYSRARVVFPLRLAEVIGPTGLRRAMSAAVPHGDCNLCHTRQGTDTPTGMAPGRITVPLP